MNAAAGAATVLVTGGTGQVGLLALPHLLQGGCRVVAVSRRVPPGPAVVQPLSAGSLAWLNPASLDAWLLAQPPAAERQLLSCGPIALASDLLRRDPAIRRVVCISTSSIYHKADSADTRERAMIRSIIANEQVIREHCLRQAAGLVLLRPTLIYGCGLDENITWLARWIRRWRFVPLAGRASGLRQPLHAGDLAVLAVRALASAADAGLESPVAGGETLSYREMVRRVFTALGQTPRLVTLPPGALQLALGLAGGLGAGSRTSGQFAVRQNTDLVFDDSPVRAQLAFAPRPFHPAAADFCVPPAAGALQPTAALRDKMPGSSEEV